MTIIPQFTTAADQEEWFLQMGLYRRMQSGIDDSDTRARLIVSIKQKGIFPFNDRYEAIIPLEEDYYWDTVKEEVFDAICLAKTKDGELDVSYSISGARGTNMMKGHGSVAKCSDGVFADLKEFIQTAKAESLLTPVPINYDTAVLEKYGYGD